MVHTGHPRVTRELLRPADRALAGGWTNLGVRQLPHLGRAAERAVVYYPGPRAQRRPRAQRVVGVVRTRGPGWRARPTGGADRPARRLAGQRDRKSTRLNSSHVATSYAVFCLKNKKND